MDGTELHILNGDYACELWKKCNFQTQSLVWREIYLEGPLPDTDDLAVFRAARAEYLSHFTELAGIGAARLGQYLRKLDESVLNLPDESELMLWFDRCIFDQTLIMRILYLLARRKTMPGNVFLYCCDGYCLTDNDFKNGYAGRIQLLPHDLRTAGKAWLLFLRKDADGLLKLAREEDFERLTGMKKALIRCADEMPDQNGLTRTQRQIMQLVAAGRHSFPEIFKGLDAFEEYPFLGDTACRRQLEVLVRKGLLKRRHDDYDLRQE